MRKKQTHFMFTLLSFGYSFGGFHFGIFGIDTKQMYGDSHLFYIEFGDGRTLLDILWLRNRVFWWKNHKDNR